MKGSLKAIAFFGLIVPYPPDRTGQLFPGRSEAVDGARQVRMAKGDPDDDALVIGDVEHIFHFLFIGGNETDRACPEPPVVGREEKIAQTDAHVDESGLREGLVDREDDSRRGAVEIAAPLVDVSVEV